MAFFLSFLICLFSGIALANNSTVIAKLDGKPITKQELIKYANSIPNSKYREMLKTDEGLRKLAELYIQRQILLEEAKKTVDKNKDENKSIFSSHGKMDEDTIYLIAYLTKEVEKKINITPEEIQSYMKEKNLSKQQAVSELASKKRREIYFSLIDKLKKKHKIEYCIGADSKSASK
jgi:hypothetical protein